ncbi:MAG TPA: SDR family NAD(P)-dependent oxidoreductase [Trebonia sp.]|jgi:NAD(P)-dependent dehydrogenase (short-subunit alcohol dehydrogenase family)|nr:SDR family NAD(P)-dependent oxidoreductase [Trebonia sp.]
MTTAPEHLPTALVTGAAGGIGSAIAARLAADGYRVVAADLSAERLAALADSVANVVPVPGDVSTVNGIERAVAAAGGSISVLCNAAGVADGGASVEELTDDLWHRVIQVNLTAIYLACNRVVPLMIGHGGGVIINISSVAGLRGGRAGAAYTSSKWAVVGLSQNIAASVGIDGVRCHAICPSRITGKITLSQGLTRTPKGIFRAGRDAGRPKPGHPDDVAGLTSFLVSDTASHLNGLAVPLDGGWLAF